MTGITGRTYLEAGQPVTVITQWRTGTHTPLASPSWLVLVWLRPPGRAPRNVLIRRASGDLVVRPFRGLRTPPAPSPGSRPQGGDTL